MRRVLGVLVLVALPAHGADVRSPHGRDDACTLCHGPTEDGDPLESIPFQTGSADGSCRACHDADPHEVGLPAADIAPEGWPLLDGRLACLSCHDEPSCDGHVVPEEDPYFLRGGPYAHTGELCAQCHQVTGTERFNPHRAMADSPGASDLCLHCHLDVPEEGASKADLKVTGPNICLGCHVESPHAGADVHLGAVPEPMLADVEHSGLPITEHHEIVCITCHDPHPGHILERSPHVAGVGTELFPRRWVDTVLEPALNDRGGFEPKEVEPDFLRLPLQGGQLCAACHTPASIEASRGTGR